MSQRRDMYETVAYPKLQRVLAMMYTSVQRTHKTHGLIEVDVTEPRRLLRARANAGEALSFTAFIIGCVAYAAGENRVLNAVHKGARHLAIFDTVDVVTPIERELDGNKQSIMYIVREANTKGVREITSEIRAAQLAPVKEAWEGFGAERWLSPIPMVVLQAVWALFWWARRRMPQLQKRYGGTVGLTSVGMFGRGGGWAIPLDYHTLDVTLGGIAQKPGIVNGQIAIREYLCVTLSFDHDVVDGAPAARFVEQLRELIENGYGLGETEVITQPAAV